MRTTLFSCGMSLFMILAVGCKDDGDMSDDTQDSSAPLVIPSEIPLDGQAWSEDVTAHDSRVFVSNFVSGGIQVYDLGTAPETAQTFVAAPTTGALKSFWGLRVIPEKGWLVAITNINYFFDGNISEPGVVRAYNLSTGAEEASWTLPDYTVGNSIDVDNDGNLYVGDIGPDGKIVRINPATDAVEVWKDNTDWGAGGFGHGGMGFDGQSALYTVINGAMWRVPIQTNGSAGTATKVALVDGAGAPIEQVLADGLSFADTTTIYYAQNDAFVPGAQGVVYKASLDGAGGGDVTVAQEQIEDCSGVFTTTWNGEGYLLVNESQFGHYFGVEQGDPGPFRVLVYPTE